MGVRAKMYIQSIEHLAWGTVVKLQVVSRGEDNKAWSAATPAGGLSLTIKNEQASNQFTLEQIREGQEFFIDITPVPNELAGKEGMGEGVA